MKPSKLILAALTGLGFLALLATANAATVTYVITSDHSTDQTVTGGNLPSSGITLTVTEMAGGILDINATVASGWGFIFNGGPTLGFALNNPFTSLNFTAVAPTTFGTTTGANSFSVGPTQGVSLANPVTGVTAAGGVNMGGNVHVGDATHPGYFLTLNEPNPSTFATALHFQIQFAGLTLAALANEGYACSGGPTCPTQSSFFPGFFFADVRNPQGLTGVVDFGLSQVPLPPAALLFGTALVGMGILGRRRRKHRSAA